MSSNEDNTCEEKFVSTLKHFFLDAFVHVSGSNHGRLKITEGEIIGRCDFRYKIELFENDENSKQY